MMTKTKKKHNTEGKKKKVEWQNNVNESKHDVDKIMQEQITTISVEMSFLLWRESRA